MSSLDPRSVLWRITYNLQNTLNNSCKIIERKKQWVSFLLHWQYRKVKVLTLPVNSPSRLLGFLTLCPNIHPYPITNEHPRLQSFLTLIFLNRNFCSIEKSGRFLYFLFRIFNKKFAFCCYFFLTVLVCPRLGLGNKWFLFSLSTFLAKIRWGRGEAPGVRTEALDLVRREPSLSKVEEGGGRGRRGRIYRKPSR